MVYGYKVEIYGNINFSSCFIRVWNLVSHIEEGTEAVGESNGARQDCTVRSLLSLCCSQYIICMVSSRRMRWVGHAAHIAGEERCIQGFGGET